mmetsp:Transcript_27407/g.63402  ORF Transcript_27407/g.63402 Transcript_27407/m.63402 type:complete len:425 (+) Transcript_27407:616-1890(+)
MIIPASFSAYVTSQKPLKICQAAANIHHHPTTTSNNNNIQQQLTMTMRMDLITMVVKITLVATLLLSSVSDTALVQAFTLTPPTQSNRASFSTTTRSTSTSTASTTLTSTRLTSTRSTRLQAKATSGSGNKKRRRKRKQQPTTASKEEKEQDLTATPPPAAAAAAASDAEPISDSDKDLIGEIAKFEFQPSADGAALPKDLSGISDSNEVLDASDVVQSNDPAAIPLPDIKDTLKRKQLQQELEQMEQEAANKQVKIKRSDTDAFLKLLEQDPYADSDDSLFEKEEYGTVSALLGEGAKPFLGIPFELLQVGHFIGALGIVLMAFVEYPGFPLTNLPTPLRDALAGGLGTVYGLNVLLAIYVALIQAPARGQDSAIWGLKTLGVGGLALDQLTQLPTLEQIEKAESRKGARALNKNKTGKPFRG